MMYSQSGPGENQTVSDMFILVGFSYLGELQILLFLLLLVLYLVALIGNLLVILLIKLSPSLHTPMYFFLVNLSFLEICFTSSIFPQLLVHLLVKEKPISLVGCTAQQYICSIMGLTECCLLAPMAYDRYVAICHPLRYTTIMSGLVCVQLAGASWAISISVELALVTWLLSLPQCGSHRIHHFFCDVPPLMKMVCTDTSNIRTVGFTVTMLFILGPFLLILLSYVCILSTILRLPSAKGRCKAFSTCSSHLMVVTLLWNSPHHLPHTQVWLHPGEQTISLLNTIVAPVLNPLIYTLRNKEVKGALRRMVRKIMFAHSWRNQRMKS